VNQQAVARGKAVDSRACSHRKCTGGGVAFIVCHAVTCPARLNASAKPVSIETAPCVGAAAESTTSGDSIAHPEEML